jgi:hypothetical protein
VDQHRLDANPNPDPNFHFDADRDPDPDWHKKNADPHAVPTRIFTYAVKWDFF